MTSTFQPTLDPAFRYWELSRAATKALNDKARAEIWKHWDDALGDPLDGAGPQAGYWKMRHSPASRWIPVAIWMHDGEMVALVGAAERALPSRVWFKCGRNPIAYDEYEYAVEHGRFRGEVDVELPQLSNSAEDPNAKYREDMISLLAQVEAFFKTLPDPITEEGANALINFKDLVTASEKTATALLAAEIEGHKKEIAQRKEIWGIPLSAATDIVARIKLAVKPFLLAKAEAGEEVRLGGQGTGSGRPRTTGLRGAWKAEIVDWDRALEAFSEHDQLRELVQKLANAAARSPELRKEPIPGIRFFEEKTL